MATKIYGPQVLKFTAQVDVKLLRLDRNADGFHLWLKNTDSKEFSQAQKDILYSNFGYPRDGSDGAAANGQLRSRHSESQKDETMLEMIKAYAKATDQTIHGYYNQTMRNGSAGKLKAADGKGEITFHAEVAVFDGKAVFGEPSVISEHDEAALESLNRDARLIQLGEDLRAKRLANKESRKRQRDDS